MSEFVDIPGYEGLYKINNRGDVLSLPRRGAWGIEMPMSRGVNEKGYIVVHLTKNSKQKKHKVHRLVAICFVSNPGSKPEVNHKDGDKNNNLFSNLEWVTRLENMQHAWATGLKKGVSIPRKLTAEKVAAIRARLRISGITLREVAEEYKVSISNVSEIKNNKIWETINISKPQK